MSGTRGSSVNMVTRSYKLDEERSVPGRGKDFLSLPPRSDRLWDPFSLLLLGTGGKMAEAWS